MKILNGKVALVTGGSRGLGAATALALAGQGADVAISYIVAKDRAEGVVQAIKVIGTRGTSFQADQANQFAASTVVDRVVERFGRIDILVSNASIDVHGSIDDPDRHQPTFDHFWSIALAGFMATVRATSRVIAEDGRIIMIGSNLGTRTGAPGFADIAAAKGAIDGFSRGVARDLASRRVTVNVVHSGIMDTEIHGDAGAEAFKPFFSTLCFPRFARVEEVVAPILFFASPAASFITGSSIDVDGGFNA